MDRAETSVTRLIKFCKPEHNVLCGAKLQIGTLNKYRLIEDQELVDGNEGAFEFGLDFADDVELSQDWVNLLCPGIISISEPEHPSLTGSYEIDLDDFEVEISIGSKRSVVASAGASVKVRREMPNCFLFCMSKVDGPDEVSFAGYESSWSIAREFAKEFSNKVGNILWRSVTLSSFDPEVVKRLGISSTSELELTCSFGPIDYRDRWTVVTNEQIADFRSFYDMIKVMYFYKPKSFEKDKEFRFIFRFSKCGVEVPPVVEDILIDVSSFIKPSDCS